MTQIKYNQLEESLKPLANKELPQLVLLWGEKYLTAAKADFIVSNLISKKERELSYTVLQGDSLNATEIIEEISTFAVFLNKKVVFAKEINFVKQELERLYDFINKGIPDKNFLILTCSKIDKRSSFFKIIKEKGLAVDCTIPLGLSKRDLNEQTQFLRNEMKEILKQYQKEIEEKAFINLVDLTGFNPEVFKENLQKLVSYIGEKNRIGVDDVSELIKRTKVDPIFDFTNAFSDKNIKKCLFFLSSLLNSNFHVLQILKALSNHIRKIFAVKCFIEHFNEKNKKIWIKGQDFNRFNNFVVPEIKKADTDLKKELDSWMAETSDFFLASKSKSTYPEYQIFKKSDNFSSNELENIIIELGELDNKFKSTSQDERILIKDFIFRTLC
jgi:DNA polymerase III delta subunit